MLAGPLVDPGAVGAHHRVGIRVERLVERGGRLRGHAVVGVDEDEQVLRPREVRVEGPLRERHRPQQRIELLGGRIVDPPHHERDLLALRRLDRELAADLEVVVVRELVPDDRPVEAERQQHVVRALLPAEVVDVADRGRVDPRDVDVRAEAARLVVAHRRGGRHSRRARQRVARAGRERVVAVLGGHDVVGAHLILERVAGGALEARAQRGHERHEREPDHQRAGRAGRARGIARGVVLGERARRSAEALARAPRPRPRAAAPGATRSCRRR